jgi:hypothetical protein
MRDPLKHRASMFQHGVQVHKDGNLRLEDWLAEEQSSNRQTKMIAGNDDVNSAIRIIRTKLVYIGLTDKFDESLVLLKSLFAPDLNILYRSMRVAIDNSVSRRVITSEKSRQMLIRGNKADIELYNYVKNELYPQYRKEYGPQLGESVRQFQKALIPYQQQKVSQSLFERKYLRKLGLMFQLQPYNQCNVIMSLLKSIVVYRNFVYLYRRVT